MTPIGSIVPISLLILNCSIVICVDVDDIEDYNDVILLVSDVQSYYKAASVFIVYSGDDESLETTSLLHRFQREFSDKFIPSLTLNYTDIVLHHVIYKDHIVKPLFIVLLASDEEVTWFQHLTANYDMSYAIWIVIFTNAEMDICYRPRGNPFNLAFDTEMLVKCQSNTVIREWYSLHEKETKTFELARWDPENRLQLMTKESLFERRRNLEGKNFPVVIVKETPATECQRGFFADVLLQLSEALNFTVTIAYKEDHYGLYNETSGEWTGAVGRLVAGEVEFGVSEFTMTGDRLAVLDFTPPILMSRNLLFVSQPQDSSLNWSAYSKVYTYPTWIVILSMIFFSIAIITLIRMINREEKILPAGHVSQNWLHVIGIVLQQSLPTLPQQSSLRIAYYSVHLKSVVLYAVYSACLISYLTNNSPSLPFSDFSSFAKDGSYKLVVMRESAPYDLITTSNNSEMQKVVTMMPEPFLLPSTATESFEQVCSGKVAFYSDGGIKDLYNNRIPCKVTSIDIGRIDSLAITMKKKSSYRGLINFHFLKLMGSGILYRMLSRMNRRVTPSDNKYVAVNFKSITPILVVFAGGWALSWFILSVEVLIWRYYEDKKKIKIRPDYKDDICVIKKSVDP